MLVDNVGRVITKLRVSLTDRCNLRCHYCMPEDARFMSKPELLQVNDYLNIIKVLTSYGLKEVRITGGEPLMRPEFNQFIQALTSLKLEKVALTTNAILLDRHFDVLKQAHVTHLNISLDSLKSDRFKMITKRDFFSRTLENIINAAKLGFEVKLNMIAMRGLNDDEFFDFVEFASLYNINVRFLELMRIGYACESQEGQFISAEEIIKTLKTRYDLKPVMSAHDSTTFNFITNTGAKIGFMASESLPFCANCSRWRLSANGKLYGCLLSNEGLDVRGLNPVELEQVFVKLLKMKPVLRAKEVNHHMNTIGG